MALVGMISLPFPDGVEKPPELTVELFKTLSVFLQDCAFETIESFMSLLGKANLLAPAGMPEELNQYEAKLQEFPIVQSFLGMMQILLSLHTAQHLWLPTAKNLS